MSTFAAGRPMVELTRSNDPVLLSFVAALLEEEGIVSSVADTNFSIMEGSIGAFPRRVLVDADRVQDARELVAEAGVDLGTS